MSASSDARKIEDELRGKTLQVYLYMLSNGNPVGIREVQRELGFSSPSVAHHHVEKLLNLGIVGKDEYGRYVLNRQVDISILQAFTRVGRHLLPRLSFHAAFFTTVLVTYLILYGQAINIHTLAIGTLSALAFWYEAVRAWRKKPF